MTELVRLGGVLRPRPEELVNADKDYSIVGVYSFGRGLLARHKIKGSETRYRKLTRIQIDDVVYSKLGAFEGAVAVVDSTFDGAYVSPEFPVFSVRSDVDPSYLGHLLTSEGFADQLRVSSTGIGARQKRVHPATFLGLEVPLPDIDEQRRIAAHLDSMARIKHIPHRNRTFFRSLKERIFDMMLREAGDSVELGRILAPKGCEAVSADEPYRVAGVYSFGRGLLDRGSIKGTETKYATFTRLDPGDVVYSKLGAFEGAVAVVDDRYSGAYVSPEFPVFTITGDVDPNFLRHQLTSPSFEQLLASTSAGVGARQKRVHPKDFLSLSITLPERPLQERWAAVLGKVDATWELSQQAARLSNALLPAARNEIFNAMR